MMAIQITNSGVKRIEYIDIAKGIGILLVVLGHNYNLKENAPFIFRFIFSFHIPLFFFLSGFIFHLPSTFIEMVKKRFSSLLLPFLTTIFLLYFMDAFFTGMNFVVIVSRLAKSVLYAGGFYIEWVQLWFLPHLFIVSIFAYVMLKFISNKYIRWILLIAGLAVSQHVISYFWPFRVMVSGEIANYGGLPYSFDLILICGFFFLLGNEIGKLDLSKPLSNWLLLPASFFGLLALNLYSNARLDIFMRTFDSLWINTLEAVLGIIFVLSLSVQIKKYSSKLSFVLTYFGRISLFILIFHWYIQEIWRVKLLELIINPALIIIGSFLASVVGSVFIYEIFIKPNPVLSFLFGKKPDTRNSNS